MRHLALSPFILLLLASAASAQDVISLQSPVATVATTANAKGDPNKVVCENIERTGSRLAVDKVCMTIRQWRDHREGQRDDLEKVQRLVNQSPSR